MPGEKCKALPLGMTAPWTNPAPLADVPDGEVNLLHRSAWSDVNNPLRVEFKPWYDIPPPVPGSERVDVFLDDERNVIETKTWALPMSDSDYFIEVSANKLPEGEHKLGFIMTNFDDVPDVSDLYTITIDKTAPLLATDSTLIFPPEVSPPQTITAAYLADPANNNEVLATVPDYSEKKVGDVITWYWETSPGGQQVAGTKTLELADLGVPVKVAFSGDLIRRGNGEFYASYRVRDRAGNGDDVLSTPQPMKVYIRPPTPRKYPSVKGVSNNNGSGEMNALLGRDGLTVVVEASEIDPLEEVVVDFVGAEGVGSATGVKPIIAGGLEFAIPASVVAANIPVSGKGTPISVYYWAGYDTVHSAVFALTVNALSPDALGRVNCLQAQTGSPVTLSKNDVPLTGANLVIAKWPYQAAGQLMQVWADVAGVETFFVDGVPNDTDGTFNSLLPKDYVDALPINSRLSLRASVSFDEGRSYIPFGGLPLKIIA